MKKTALILIMILPLVASHSAAQGFKRNAKSTPKANVGIRAGFNSSMFVVDHLAIGEKELSNVQNNYKVGYQGGVFCRFNINKWHFIQPEVNYNVFKGSTSIPYQKGNKKLLPDNALVKSSMHVISMPLLYGYRFINHYPYGMAAIVGPQLEYCWNKQSKHEYSGFYQQEIQENLRKLLVSGVIGLAVNVSNIYFDFRYEIGFQRLSSGVDFNADKTPLPFKNHPIQLKRRKNILSFSTGVIF